MKKFLFSTVAIALALVGCLQDPHAADREQNAIIGGTHQISLEACLKAAEMQKHTGADAGEIRSDFDKCMEEADKAAGKK